MEIKIKNLSRSMLRLPIIGLEPLLPGETTVVSEFSARRAQLMSLIRINRLQAWNADTGEELPAEMFRPKSSNKGILPVIASQWPPVKPTRNKIPEDSDYLAFDAPEQKVDLKKA